MERSVSPRLVFNPGPSPWGDPDPVTVAIWRPTGINAARNPHVPVFRNIAPGAVFVEVFRTNYVRRDVAGRCGMIKTPIA